MNRYRWIDELRGFAIFLVIMGHVIGGTDVAIGGGEDNYIREIIYLFHMPLLFIISGLVAKDHLALSYKGYIVEIKRIIIGLYIPYLLFGYLFWGVKYFVYMGNEAVTVKNAFNLFFDYTAWVPGWYLLALVGIKLMDLLLRQKREFLRLFIWIILYFISLYIQLPAILSIVFGNGLYFEIGKCLKKRNYIIKIPTTILIIGIFIVIILDFSICSELSIIFKKAIGI